MLRSAIFRTLFTVATAAFAAGCYDTPEPDCAFLCSDDGACPASYSCRPDGWCKRDSVDDSFMCDIVRVDAAVPDAAPTPDAAPGTPDGTPTPDGPGTPDAAIPDATPPDATPPDAIPPDAMRKADGVSCTLGTECTSGNCSDLVCCNLACGGDCDACSTAAGADVDGTCKILPNSVECNASTGECDTAEMCDGALATCPVDAFEAPGTACTDATPGDCDDAQCDGTGACNQTEDVETALYECRPVVGECDVAELCDGVTGGFSCGTDLFETAGIQCTDTSTDDCDDAQCDGVGACNQTEGLELDTTLCSVDGGDTCCIGTCVTGVPSQGTCP